MGTRQIIDCGEAIIKQVPKNNLSFPVIEDWPTQREEIRSMLWGLPILISSPVIQQYNEFIIGKECAERTNCVLAPLLDYSFDMRNLPILKFPKFTPLQDENEIKYIREDLIPVEFGRIAGKLNIPKNEIYSFIYGIEDIEQEFNIWKDDILFNLSNIGYNKNYGLKVIDFGLLNDKNELIL